MFNLSLTTCSFHLRRTNSKGNTKIFNLNMPLTLQKSDGTKETIQDLSEIFILFFEKYKILVKDNARQQSFQCEYNEGNSLETPDFRMFYAKIYSGIYGSSSDIIDGNTQRIKYKKKLSDIDIRPFYLMVVFPKDNASVTVQKGLFIFQNVGQFGIKTITTTLMQDFFSNEFRITLKCNTIAPDLFVKKIIRKDNIKKLIMIKNVRSGDIADNVNLGYGSEVREIADFHFNEKMWSRLMDQIRHVAGSRFNLFEFEQTEYDNLKVVVDIGGRNRIINLHNLEHLSIIEAIPDEIKMADGHPNLPMLLEHFTKVAAEYLEEMVLQISQTGGNAFE